MNKKLDIIHGYYRKYNNTFVVFDRYSLVESIVFINRKNGTWKRYKVKSELSDTTLTEKTFDRLESKCDKIGDFGVEDGLEAGEITFF